MSAHFIQRFYSWILFYIKDCFLIPAFSTHKCKILIIRFIIYIICINLDFVYARDIGNELLRFSLGILRLLVVIVAFLHTSELLLVTQALKFHLLHLLLLSLSWWATLTQLSLDRWWIYSLRCRILYVEVVMWQFTDFACKEAMVLLHNVVFGIRQICARPVFCHLEITLLRLLVTAAFF